VGNEGLWKIDFFAEEDGSFPVQNGLMGCQKAFEARSLPESIC